MFSKIFERFVSFRRVPLKVVVVTALASYVLQLGAIFQGLPLTFVAIYTLLPWIPLVFFESLWKLKHYNYIAIFGIVAFLQVGHLSEHAVQVGQTYLLNGTSSGACPPPLDSAENAQRAVELGLRPADQEATDVFSTFVVRPTAEGLPNPDGIEGPPACGVIGALDVETVHLVWDSMVWLGALYLLTKFPGNFWLWISMIAASVHQVEHMFLGYIFFFEQEPIFMTMRQLWATTVEGNFVTAHPAGMVREAVSFYEAGGIIGLAGSGGMLESMLFGGPRFLPMRTLLHFGYNLVVIIPTVIAFIVQVRRAFDEYLASALPGLTEEQLIQTTTKLLPMKFDAGTVIIQQGDVADRFYIISKGEVEVVRERDGQEMVVARLGDGQYFGEIGLLHGGKRIATVRAATTVEVMTLDRMTFNDLMDESDVSKVLLDKMVTQRVTQVKALQQSSAS